MPLVHDNYFRIPDFKLEFAIRLTRNGAVLWNNTFESLNASASVGGSGSGSGVIRIDAMGATNSWSTASTMGMADVNGTANVYIEDNIFNNVFLSAIDCDNNARTVIRYNTFNAAASFVTVPIRLRTGNATPRYTTTRSCSTRPVRMAPSPIPST